MQFLIKCVEEDVDTINLCKDKSIKVHTNELYVQFLDHFGFRTNISKIDFSRQLNKFGLKSKLVQISGSRLNGYILDYNKIISKLKDLKIECINDSSQKNNENDSRNKVNDLDFS